MATNRFLAVFSYLKSPHNFASNCTNLTLTDLLLDACTGAGFGDRHNCTKKHTFCVRARRGSNRALWVVGGVVFFARLRHKKKAHFAPAWGRLKRFKLK